MILNTDLSKIFSTGIIKNFQCRYIRLYICFGSTFINCFDGVLWCEQANQFEISARSLRQKAVRNNLDLIHKSYEIYDHLRHEFLMWFHKSIKPPTAQESSRSVLKWKRTKPKTPFWFQTARYILEINIWFTSRSFHVELLAQLQRFLFKSFIMKKVFCCNFQMIYCTIQGLSSDVTSTKVQIQNRKTKLKLEEQMESLSWSFFSHQLYTTFQPLISVLTTTAVTFIV